MSGLVEIFERAVEEFGRRVPLVGDDQWGAPTPDTGWDVRALTSHVLAEALWAPPLLEGRTIAEVGDRFDGDQLGDDPQAAWTRAAAEAVAAVREPGALERTVHVSFGEIPGAEYVSQLTCDHVIHAWDLARAIGADERLDPELVDWAIGFLSPQIDGWRAAGAFAAPVEVAEGADAQSRLLALTGRRP
jgi:uncharacterized protein (TIGR03086 family)